MNQFDSRFNSRLDKNFEDNFDKTFNRMTKGIVAVWIVAALCSLALTVAVIWAVVEVVQALT